MKAQCNAKKLFDISRVEENNEDCLPLSLLSVHENNKNNWGKKFNSVHTFSYWKSVTPGKILTKLG